MKTSFKGGFLGANVLVLRKTMFVALIGGLSIALQFSALRTAKARQPCVEAMPCDCLGRFDFEATKFSPQKLSKVLQMHSAWLREKPSNWNPEWSKSAQLAQSNPPQHAAPKYECEEKYPGRRDLQKLSFTETDLKQSFPKDLRGLCLRKTDLRGVNRAYPVNAYTHYM